MSKTWSLKETGTSYDKMFDSSDNPELNILNQIQ